MQPRRLPGIGLAVFVCHGKGRTAKTLRVGFPDAMDAHLGHGDAVGICPGQGPL